MSRSLPSKPCLRFLQKEAKALLKAHRDGDASCCETLKRLHRLDGKSNTDVLGSKIQLADVQFALAMDYGFKSWKELTARVRSEKGANHGVDAPAELDTDKAAGAHIEALLAENGMGQPAESSNQVDLEARRWLLKVIAQALRDGTSDIHLEPMAGDVKIRYRVDGVLHEMPPLPKALGEQVTAQAMRCAKLDVTRTHVPQDGRFMLTLDKRPVDFRVNAMRGVHGSVVAMRLVDRAVVALSLDRMDFEPDQLERYRRIINGAEGLIIVAGPTGSGTTTTMYGTLSALNKVGRKIMTVEDPVEYEIEGIDQIPLNTDAGIGYSQALRSILRQAPNIIMAGEIRDADTAHLLAHATLTGHLAFSTLHTNDAPGALMRLLDMGVAPFLVRDAVRCVLAQRLVRRICAKCRTEYQPDAAELDRAGLEGDDRRHAFHRGDGCDECHRTGYRGRIGVFSLLELDEGVKKGVMDKNRESIVAAARRNGWRSLREMALLKALRGETTLEEVVRYT